MDPIWHLYDFTALNLASMPDALEYNYGPWATNLNAEGDATTSVEPAAFPGPDVGAAIAESQPVWGILIQPSPDPSTSTPVFQLGAPVDISTVTSVDPRGNPSLPISPHSADATTFPGQATATPGGRRTVPCPMCNREFTRLSNMRNHVKEVHNKNPPRFECPYEEAAHGEEAWCVDQRGAGCRLYYQYVSVSSQSLLHPPAPPSTS